MPAALKLDTEQQRLETLVSLGLDGPESDPWCDEAAAAAAAIAGCPMAAVSLVQADRQVFRGAAGLEVRQTGRDEAFCAHAILGSEPMVVDDATQDERVRDNPLVTGELGLRFYAGIPLVTDSGHALGTLCVLDNKPRELTAGQRAGLSALAKMVRWRLLDGERSRKAAEARSLLAAESAKLRATNARLEGELDRRDMLERELATQAEARADAERMVRAHQYALDTAGIVAVTDRRGTITHVNDNFCKISGYTRAELLGQNHRLLSSGHHPKSFFKDMYARIGRGLHWRGEICNRNKTGELYWVDTTIVPRLDRHGQVEEYIALRIDVTSRKAAEAELVVAKAAAESSSRAKSEFLANMSHEIRTPLTALLGFADLLCTDEDLRTNDVRRAEVGATIQNAGQHLLTIINDILDLSKIEASKLIVETIETHLPTVVLGVESLLRPRATEKGLTLTARVVGAIPERVMSDPTRLRQILLNLLGNAVKFTETGSVTLSLSAYINGGEPMLVADIADTGPGLTSQQAARLFAPFVQGDATVTRRAGGTGLGLAICRRLAQLMGGDVRLVRTEPGRGSLFRLTLPVRPVPGSAAITTLHAAAADQLPRLADQPSAPARPKPLDGRVLLVEDGPDNQRLIALHLRRAGALVEIAEHGQTAMEMVQDASRQGRPYDLIVSDMQMPVMDGYTLAATLRNAQCSTPIIALTAHAMAEDRQRCLAAGCDDFATKPIDREALIAVCARWLGRRSEFVDGHARGLAA